jgi:hypothetical protein
MKFAHKSGIVWKIYLIELYICSANCPNGQYYVLDSQHATLRITIDKCMDIFDINVHLYNNIGKIFIKITVQPFYIDNILKEYCINISWKAGKRGQIEDMHDSIMSWYCLSLYSLVGSFDKQFPTKIVH